MKQKSCVWRLTQNKPYRQNLQDNVDVTELQLLQDFTYWAGILPSQLREIIQGNKRLIQKRAENVKRLWESFILMHYHWMRSLSNAYFLKGPARQIGKLLWLYQDPHKWRIFTSIRDQHKMFYFDLLCQR